MRLNELHGAPDLALIHEAWRLRLASLLMRMSAGLTRSAVKVGGLQRRSPPLDPLYADAGAPEGALFVVEQKPGALPRRDVKAITRPVAQPVTQPFRGLA